MFISPSEIDVGPREPIGPNDRKAFFALAANELYRFYTNRGRDIPEGTEELLDKIVATRQTMIKFLQGEDDDPAVYDAKSWRPFQFCHPKFDSVKVLAMIADKSVKREILAGMPWSFKEHSSIPNTIAIFKASQGQNAVKVGREEAIRRTTRALVQLQDLHIYSTSSQAAYPSGFASTIGLKTGMLITDYIDGVPMLPKMWASRPDDLRAYCMTKFVHWRADYLRRNQPGTRGHGFTFFDGLSPENCIIDPSGFVFIVDADGYKMEGRADLNEGYISGGVVSSAALELGTVGVHLSDLGFTYEPAGSKVYLPY